LDPKIYADFREIAGSVFAPRGVVGVKNPYPIYLFSGRENQIIYGS